MGAHTKILYDVMYGKTRDFMAPFIISGQMLLSFPRASVTCKAERTVV